MDLIFSIFFFLLTDSLENINRHKLLTQIVVNKKSPTFVEDLIRGVGGVRTLVQTTNIPAFYMLIS